MPRLTEAEADELAREALIAMALDEYKADLRAEILKMPHAADCDSRFFGPKNEYLQCDCWRWRVLALISYPRTDRGSNA